MAMTTEKPTINRQTMANRLAMEFQDGWMVNLGVGMPTLCSNYDFKDKSIIFHAENGVIGYGRLAEEEEVDDHLTNAGGQHVTLNPWAAITHHADSFALIRSGLLDVTVLGSYEVAENGDFANYKTKGRKGGGIGGAMDLAACAKRVFIIMEQTTREGEPRLLKRCTLPLTAPGVATLVCTNLGLFEVTSQGFLLKEIAPGYTPEEVQEVSEAKLIISPDLKELKVY